MRKNIEINGVAFENMGCQDVSPLVGHVYCHSDIFEVYGRPSVWKVNIWKKWCKWAEDIDDSDYNNFAWIEITSHNAQTFTITGQVCYKNQAYRIMITKAHNRAWLLNEA